jgi:hypothetical protein
VNDFGAATEEDFQFWLEGLTAYKQLSERAKAAEDAADLEQGDGADADERRDTLGQGSSRDSSLLDGPNAIRHSMTSNGCAPLTRPRKLTGDL